MMRVWQCLTGYQEDIEDGGMKLIEAIREYFVEVEKALALLQERFGREDVLRALREGVIPERGRLASGVEFRFHGAGCRLNYDGGREVDFDFLPDGRRVGVDVWRIWRYAAQFPDRFPEYAEKASVAVEFMALASDGTLVPLDREGRTFTLKDRLELGR